ncbi:unnamed protein product [Rotaria sp. Silwood2]|nr:unnamed protein product [Rotaria sp. Silwood2]
MTDINSTQDTRMDQDDDKTQQEMKYRAMFDYSLSQPIREQKPEWSSKRLAKLQERRPIKDPVFVFLHPSHTIHYGNPDNMTNFKPK